MAITRAKKGEIVEKLTKAFKDAKSLVFVNFRGLTVGNTTDMRRQLKKGSVSYTVAKKSLTKLALGNRKIEGEVPVLEGELALAWGEDLIAPSREVYSFQKKFPENLKILGGIFEGRYVTKNEIESMALIPSLDVLRGKFVNIINSPIQRITTALGAIAQSRS